MALTVNTNISSLVAQRNLNNSTNALNKAIERMTTGYKINHAADNAAGFSIATQMRTHLGSLDVAADNAATASDMLTTLEDTYSLITSHLERVRDLTEQAANGTYATQSREAIEAEINSRLEEIDRIADNCEFNGKNLMDGTIATDIAIQVGIYNSSASQITLDSTLFASSKVNTILGDAAATIANKCAGLTTGTTSASMLDTLDAALNTISSRVTTLGAAQNRLDSAIESINVQSTNLTSSLSTLRDADVAEESSNYIQAQILQQASATLLATANQLPSIALNLI